MTNPHSLLAIISVGASILAFQRRDLMNQLVLYPYIMVRKKQWYRLITHAFIHADWMHLLFNMIALYTFGAFVFTCLTHGTSAPVAHFFIMYFGAIMFSSVHDLIKHRNNPNFASLGASGAVSAVIFCSILFEPWTPLFIFFIPCPGIIFSILYLVYSSYMSRKNSDIINHDAHIYGAIFGLLYPLFINPEIYSLFIDKLLHPHF